jgi:NDP-sugar pyrophosphorylase family protein
MINIVVPMAGAGSRFAAVGEFAPKPLIEVQPGKCMIEYVVNCLSLREPHRLIFIYLAEHDRVHGLGSKLRNLADGCELVLAERKTSGPVATSLLAARYVDNDDELLIAYCDSFLTIDLNDFLDHNRRQKADGGLIVYPSTSLFDSYAALNAKCDVLRTAEKLVISTHATAGFYYFWKGRDYIAGARAIVANNTRETELFVCPVYNELIKQGKRIISYAIERDQQIEMGTPDDLARSRKWLAESNWEFPQLRPMYDAC